MNALPLLHVTDRPGLRAASWANWDRIVHTLAAREIAVYTATWRYLEDTGYPDVTGGELAAWSGVSILQVRPRLTGLVAKGWLYTGTLRPSRASGEAKCHPVWPAVPIEAIERIAGRRG